MGEWRQRGRRNRIFNRGRKECLLSVCNSASVFTCRLNNTNLPPTHPPQSMYPVTMFSPVSVTCNRSSSFSSPFLHHSSALLPLLLVLSKLRSFESSFHPLFLQYYFPREGIHQASPRRFSRSWDEVAIITLDRPFNVEIARVSGRSKDVDHEIHRFLEIPGCLHVDYRTLW